MRIVVIGTSGAGKTTAGRMMTKPRCPGLQTPEKLDHCTLSSCAGVASAFSPRILKA